MVNRLDEICELVLYEKAKYRHHQLYLISSLHAFAESIKDKELEEQCQREINRLKKIKK